jgi:hypothetical protein
MTGESPLRVTHLSALEDAIDAKTRALDQLNRMAYRHVTMEGVIDVPRPREIVVRFTDRYTQQREKLQALINAAKLLDAFEDIEREHTV